MGHCWLLLNHKPWRGQNDSLSNFTKTVGNEQQEAHQLIGRAMQNATPLNLKIFRYSVTLVILRQTVAELLDSLLAGPVLRTFVQYSVAFCSRPKAANDVISGVAVDYVRMNVLVKFINSRSNRS